MKIRHSFSVVAGAIIALIFCHCNFFYNPVTQPQPIASVSSRGDTTATTLYAVNPGRQICNPSASQDSIHFKACMLYLNLGGALPVHVPDDWKSQYSTYAETPHDRLTIVDTSNTVRWFLMKPSFVPEAEMQKPQWSSHPNYIAFLGDADEASDGYIVRISDKSVFHFNESKVQVNSTPDIWVRNNGDAPAPDRAAVAALFNQTPSLFDEITGMASKQTVVSYFNTDSVKIVFSKDIGSSGLTIGFIDYSRATPRLVMLSRPAGKEGMACDRPRISPDGNWIVFNCKNGSLKSEAYLQRLAEGSTPMLLHDGTAAEPHWWRSPSDGKFYALYCTAIGPLSWFLDQAPQDGSRGATIIRSLNLSSALSWQILNENEITLCGLPFQGGITSDGRYLATGYQYGYIFSLPSP